VDAEPLGRTPAWPAMRRSLCRLGGRLAFRPREAFHVKRRCAQPPDLARRSATARPLRPAACNPRKSHRPISGRTDRTLPGARPDARPRPIAMAAHRARLGDRMSIAHRQKQDQPANANASAKPRRQTFAVLAQASYCSIVSSNGLIRRPNIQPPSMTFLAPASHRRRHPGHRGSAASALLCQLA